MKIHKMNRHGNKVLMTKKEIEARKRQDRILQKILFPIIKKGKKVEEINKRIKADI